MGVIVITRNFFKSNEPKAPDDDVNTFSHPVPRRWSVWDYVSERLWDYPYNSGIN